MQLYTLEVYLLSGPITKQFAKKNPVISRTIEMQGDQTLEDITMRSSTPLAPGKNTYTSSNSARDR